MLTQAEIIIALNGFARNSNGEDYTDGEQGRVQKRIDVVYHLRTTLQLDQHHLPVIRQ
ncbi:hypothetical protein D9M73_242010 [compost metagenome]